MIRPPLKPVFLLKTPDSGGTLKFHQVPLFKFGKQLLLEIFIFPLSDHSFGDLDGSNIGYLVKTKKLNFGIFHPPILPVKWKIELTLRKEWKNNCFKLC